MATDLSQLRKQYPNTSDETLKKWAAEERMTYKQKRKAALKRKKS